MGLFFGVRLSCIHFSWNNHDNIINTNVKCMRLWRSTYGRPPLPTWQHTRCSHRASLMLDQHRRRWIDIKPAQCQSLLFVGYYRSYYRHHIIAELIAAEFMSSSVRRCHTCQSYCFRWYRLLILRHACCWPISLSDPTLPFSKLCLNCG